MLFLSTLAVGLFVSDDGSRKSYWQILCAVALLGLTHYFGLILAGGILCWLFFQSLKSPKRVVSVCLVALVVLVWPIIQYFEGALGGKTGGKFWIQVDGPFGTLNVFFQALAPVLRTWGTKFNIVLTVMSTVLIVLLLVYRFKRARNVQNLFEKSLIFKMSFCLVWVLSAVAIMDLHTPISTDRNYIALLPLVSILFGLGLGAVAEIRYAAIAILAIALTWGKMQIDYSHTLLTAQSLPLQNWKASAEYMVQHGAGRQLYYLRLTESDEVDRVFNYYLKPVVSG